MMNLWELLQKDYISSPRYCKESWLNMSKMDTTWDWTAIDRVPIKKIKIDKTLMSFPNDVDDDEVTYMINNFEEDVWEPILANSDYYLLDGQHRLRLAFRTGKKFIDVIMEKKKDPLVSKKLKDAIKRKEKLEKLMDSVICKNKGKNPFTPAGGVKRRGGNAAALLTEALGHKKMQCKQA